MASVSVIVSAYNADQMLRKSLSILAGQRHQFVECIVVNDGSTDGSMRFAADFGARIIEVPVRRGPANARNLGALSAKGDILLFLDADVCIHEDTISRVRERFQADPSLGAVFGSYDNEPEAPGVVSQFRNLLHCYIHHTSRQRATTFWAGCGAIRRSVFLASGGFNVSYAIPCVEDIELGDRLVRHGVRVELDPNIQVKHLKEWTLRTMVETDIFYRGIPWTRLIMSSGRMPLDLNLRLSSRLSVGLTALIGLLGGFLATAAVFGDSVRIATAAALIFAALVATVALNGPFYHFLARRRQTGLTVAAVPLHMVYFLCCGAGLLMGIGLHLSEVVWKAGRLSVKPAVGRD